MVLSASLRQAAHYKLGKTSNPLTQQPRLVQPVPGARPFNARTVILPSKATSAVVPDADLVAPAVIAPAAAQAASAPGARVAVAKTASLGGRGQQVVVLGADGSTGLRIARELLSAGFKVAAGVTAIDEARQFASLAKKYDLVPSSELGNLVLQGVDLRNAASTREAANVMPKRVPYIIIDGDQVGSSRNDARVLQTAVDLARQQSASQLVLVSAGGGGGFFGFGGGGGRQPTQNEKLVISSGLLYTIIRANGLDRAPASNNAATAVAPIGSLAVTSSVSKEQVALVVSEVLQLTPLPFGLHLEVGTAPPGSSDNLLVDSLNQAVAAISADAAAAAAALAAEEAARPSPAAAPAPPAPPRSASASPAATRGGFSLFGGVGGTRRAAVAAELAPPAEAEPAVVATSSKPFDLFGAVRRTRSPPADAQPGKSTYNMFSDGSTRGVVKGSKATEATPAKNGGFSLFGRGSLASASSVEESDDEEVAALPFFGLGGSKKVTVGGSQSRPTGKTQPRKVGGVQSQSVPKLAAPAGNRRQEAIEEPKKSGGGGFFAWARPVQLEEVVEAPRRGNAGADKSR